MDIVNKMLGDTVHSYFFNMVDGTGTGVSAFEYTKYQKLEVVYESSNTIILNTPDLTKIAKGGENMGTALNELFVYLRLADSYWGNTIDFMLYSNTLYTNEELKEMLKDEIAKQTKFLGELNLSGLDNLVIGE